MGSHLDPDISVYNLKMIVVEINSLKVKSIKDMNHYINITHRSLDK